MSISSFKRMLAVSFLSAGIVGCAGTVPTQTSIDDRASSGQYDGIWQVNVQKSAAVQYYNNWHLNCGDMRNSFNIKVVDGTLVVGDGENSQKAYVSEKGRFKMYVPLARKASASGISATTISNGDTKIILRGRLADSDSNGYITYGIAEFGYGGCTAKTKFKRLKSIPRGQSA